MKAVAAIAGIVVLLVAAGALWVATLPSTASAQSRVAARLSAHGGTALTTPPPKLAEAVVVTEDEHFYANFWLNTAIGVARAAMGVVRGGPDPGGSTIDQQLAKLLYVAPKTGVAAEFRQVGLAIRLNLRWSKKTVMTMYLNTVYMGNGYYGAQRAAEGYFGKPAASLDWAQSALLAGLPQAPSAYDPVHHLAAAKARQRHVLSQLVANHVLTQAQAAADYAAPLGLR